MDIKPEGDYGKPFMPLQWLAANKIEDCILRVDPKEFTFGIPSATAVAISNIPQGVTKTDFDPALGQLASLSTFTVAQARRLETALRTLRRSQQHN